MNNKGHPKTLVRAHPGNTNAVRHGAYSSRIIEPRAGETEAEFVCSAELTPTGRIAAREVAWCMAILEAINRDLAERGVVDREGEARSLLNHRARMSRRLHIWLMVISPSIDRGSRRDDEEAPFGLRSTRPNSLESRRGAIPHPRRMTA